MLTKPKKIHFYFFFKIAFRLVKKKTIMSTETTTYDIWEILSQQCRDAVRIRTELVPGKQVYYGMTTYYYHKPSDRVFEFHHIPREWKADPSSRQSQEFLHDNWPDHFPPSENNAASRARLLATFTNCPY